MKRRDFVETTAAAAGLLIVRPETAFGYQANSTVELGLVGCGSRGNWISPFIPGVHRRPHRRARRRRQGQSRHHARQSSKSTPPAPITARAPTSELAASKVDAVVIETPPYYHPEHANAAVDAGKHVYLAKPVAVDVPAATRSKRPPKRRVARSASSSISKTRAQPVFQEAAERRIAAISAVSPSSRRSTSPAAPGTGYSTPIPARRVSARSIWTRCSAATSSSSRTFTRSTS